MGLRGEPDRRPGVGKRCQGAFMVLVQQLVKGMGGAVPVQDLPRPIVEHHLHPLDLASRQSSEPRAFGKDLAQQAIRVLVRPPLPGRMWMRKIDPHLGLFREEAVLAHFRHLVVRERAAELGRQRRSSRAKACRTVAASLAFSGTSMVNRVVRSTSVPSAEALAWPTSKSPSQCPSTVRSATSGGRSSTLIKS